MIKWQTAGVFDPPLYAPWCKKCRHFSVLNQTRKNVQVSRPGTQQPPRCSEASWEVPPLVFLGRRVIPFGPDLFPFFVLRGKDHAPGKFYQVQMLFALSPFAFCHFGVPSFEAISDHFSQVYVWAQLMCASFATVPVLRIPAGAILTHQLHFI